MGRLLQINPVIRKNTSTGKIMREIGELAASRGWESYIAYSKGRDGVPEGGMVGKSKLVPVGGRLSVALHGMKTRLFDGHGLGSRIATRRFVKDIRKIDPDIIHIHNIHGYFLNYEILFKYLAKAGKPVIWTVHDCWLYTGHCYYYTAIGCSKWMEGCGNCPQRKAFPKSLFIDRSSEMWKRKAMAFNSIPKDRFLIAPVSEWICGEMKQSYLKDCNFKVIHNGIDLEAFKPATREQIDSVRRNYGLGERHILLGLASLWIKEKGWDDFISLAGKIDKEKEVIVMVGVNVAMAGELPEGIVAIRRTESREELAVLYSAADAFINPTYQDNYPTVNLEAIACGTPVITYRTGGSIEAVTEETGRIVEVGDVEGLYKAYLELGELSREDLRKSCRERALAGFSKEDRYEDYLKLYESLTAR